MSPERTQSRQFLTVHLDRAIYAFEIKKVKEIIDPTPITRVPRMPEYMLGAINLRGDVVPVMDLCLRFSLPQKEETTETSIIIVETGEPEKPSRLGLRVDAVNQVLSLDKKQVLLPPGRGLNIDKKFILAVGQAEDDFIIILDIDRLLP